MRVMIDFDRQKDEDDEICGGCGELYGCICYEDDDEEDCS